MSFQVLSLIFSGHWDQLLEKKTMSKFSNNVFEIITKIFPFIAFLFHILDYICWVFIYLFRYEKIHEYPLDLFGIHSKDFNEEEGAKKFEIASEVKSTIDEQLVYKRNIVNKKRDSNPIPPEEVPTVSGLISRGFKNHPDSPCISYRIPQKIKKSKFYNKETNETTKDWEIIIYPKDGKNITTESYKQVHNEIESTRMGLFLSTCLKKGSKIGFIENTCKEYFILCHSCFRSGIIPVTGYVNLGIDGIFSLLNETKTPAVFLNIQQIATFFNEKIDERVPSIKFIIYHKNKFLEKNDELDEYYEKLFKNIKKVTKNKIKFINYHDLKSIGENFLQNYKKNQTQTQTQSESQQNKDIIEVLKSKDDEKFFDKNNKPTFCEDVALIMYTSGTTGKPKGVMISHKNVLSCCSSLGESLGHYQGVTYRHLSYLPMSHIYEMVTQNYMLSRGGDLCFGSPRTLSTAGNSVYPNGDLEVFKPHIFIGVPRVFNQIKKGILHKIRSSSKFVQLLFDTAFKYKKVALYYGNRDTPLWNFLVFNKMKNGIGGNQIAIISGGAPLSSETTEFLRICFCSSVFQGYGLTETCAITLVQSVILPHNPGHCGAVISGNLELKLIECPELGYTSKGNIKSGEVCFRGDPVFLGYYNQEKITKEVIDKEGFFHTGDIGVIDKFGSVKIIDRKKNICKLSQGEYVCFEQIESVISDSPFCSCNSTCLIADPQKNYVIALIHPNIKYIFKYISDELNKIDYDDKEEREKMEMLKKIQNVDDVCESEYFKELILKEIQKRSKEQGLKSFQIVKNIILYPELFTPENKMLTSTMKKKRKNIFEKYKKEITKIYV